MLMERHPKIRDIYDLLADQDRARDLRRHNKERLAALDEDQEQRTLRLSVLVVKRDPPR